MSTEQSAKPTIEGMSHRAVVNQLKDFGDEIRRVAAKTELLPEDEKYLAELEEEFERYNDYRKKLERDALVERVSATNGKPLQAEPGHTAKDLDDDPFGEPDSIREPKRFKNPWALEEVRQLGTSSEIAGEYRGRALSAIEQMSGTNDHRRQVMTEIIERADNGAGKLAKQLLVSSSPDYMRAFHKMAQGRGHALSASEQRAMSLTDTQGGYLVKVAA